LFASGNASAGREFIRGVVFLDTGTVEGVQVTTTALGGFGIRWVPFFGRS
jgi:hypothetical protein